MTSPISSMTEPDPTNPDPVTYFKTWLASRYLEFERVQAQITRWMEAPPLDPQ